MQQFTLILAILLHIFAILYVCRLVFNSKSIIDLIEATAILTFIAYNFLPPQYKLFN